MASLKISVLKAYAKSCVLLDTRARTREFFPSSHIRLAILPQYINAYMSLTVESYVEIDTHGMFICTLDEAKVVSDADAMTYTYYQENVKPKRKPEEKKKGFVCKICGYVYEGETLPEDFICPICKHGASDFEPIE